MTFALNFVIKLNIMTSLVLAWGISNKNLLPYIMAEGICTILYITSGRISIFCLCLWYRSHLYVDVSIISFVSQFARMWSIFLVYNLNGWVIIFHIAYYFFSIIEFHQYQFSHIINYVPLNTWKVKFPNLHIGLEMDFHK